MGLFCGVWFGYCIYCLYGVGRVCVYCYGDKLCVCEFVYCFVDGCVVCRWSGCVVDVGCYGYYFGGGGGVDGWGDVCGVVGGCLNVFDGVWKKVCILVGFFFEVIKLFWF